MAGKKAGTARTGSRKVGNALALVRPLADGPASAPPRSARILVADDHTLIRAGMRALLEKLRGVSEVLEARDGREAVHVSVTRRPHVVLMEPAISGLNGFDATSRIARKAPGVRVIMFSRQSGEEFVARSLHAGAAGFLVKDASPGELEVAIHAVLRGGAYLSPSVSRHVIQRYLAAAEKGGRKADILTGRQREIVQLVGEGWSSKEIAGLLGVSIKTVETHRAQIMKRLNIRDLAGLVRYAVRMGLVIP